MVGGIYFDPECKFCKRIYNGIVILPRDTKRKSIEYVNLIIDKFELEKILFNFPYELIHIIHEYHTSYCDQSCNNKRKYSSCCIL